MMKRSSLNFLVDFVSFITLVGLIFTAYIIKFILPPGSGGHGREISHGMGREHIKDLWSMTRHQWGDIHLYFAIVFLVLMIVHVILHWGWIKNYLKSTFKPWREKTE